MLITNANIKAKHRKIYNILIHLNDEIDEPDQFYPTALKMLRNLFAEKKQQN